MSTQFWKLLDKRSGQVVGVVEVDRCDSGDLAVAATTHGYTTWADVEANLGFGEGDLVAYHPGILDPEPLDRVRENYAMERIA